jgi:hypothetical protein
MIRVRQLSLFPLSVVLLMAADQPWKDKQVSDWNDADAKLVLTGSPWAKVIKPAVEPAAAQRTPARAVMAPRMRVGYPGGYPAGGYPPGSYPPGSYPGTPPTVPPGGRQATPAEQAPMLTLRWESALPIREAVMKARDPNAPTLEEGYYALAVYGVPARMVNLESKTLDTRLKGLATIRRDGQKDLKPSRVLVLQRDGGPVFVYLFARPKNQNKPLIKAEDKRLDFEAQIGRLKFGESFFLEDMVFEGKLEL